MKTLRIVLAAAVLIITLGWRWLFPANRHPEPLVISRHLNEDASKILFTSSRQHFSEEWKRDGAIWTNRDQTQVVSQEAISRLLTCLTASLPTLRGLTPEASGLTLEDRSFEIETKQGGHYKIQLGLTLLDRSGVAVSFGPYSPIQAGPVYLENFFGASSKQHFTLDLMPLEVRQIKRFSLTTKSGRSVFELQVLKEASEGSPKARWTWKFRGSGPKPQEFQGLANSSEVSTLLKELKQIRSQDSEHPGPAAKPEAEFEFWQEDSLEPYELKMSKENKTLFANRGQTKALRLPSEGEVNFDSLHELLSQRSLLPSGSGDVSRLEFTVAKVNLVFLKNAQGWSKFNEVAAGATGDNEAISIEAIKGWLDRLNITQWQINKKPVKDEKPELQFDTRMFDSKNNERGRYQLQFYPKNRLDIKVTETEIFCLDGPEVATLRTAAERVLGSAAKTQPTK